MDNPKSLFLKEIDRLFPVPLLAIEYYGDNMLQGMDSREREDVLDATLKVACNKSVVTYNDRRYLLKRLQELDKPVPEKASGLPPKKTFGSSFSNHISSLDTTQLLGMMTHYDLPSMRVLYCATDYEDVRLMLKNYVAHLVQLNLIAYESVLYGMGGNYKGDGGQNENTKVFDVSTKEGKAAMSQFGFGVFPDQQSDQLLDKLSNI
jgi:hypothetical protein